MVKTINVALLAIPHLYLLPIRHYHTRPADSSNANTATTLTSTTTRLLLTLLPLLQKLMRLFIAQNTTPCIL